MKRRNTKIIYIMRKIVNTGGRVERFEVRVKDPKKIKYYEALGYEVVKKIRIQKRKRKKKRRGNEKWKD